MSHGKLSKVFAVPAMELVCRLKEEVFGRLGDEAGKLGGANTGLWCWVAAGSRLCVCWRGVSLLLKHPSPVDWRLREALQIR